MPQSAAEVEREIEHGFKSAEPAVVKRLRGILTGKRPSCCLVAAWGLPLIIASATAFMPV